MKDINLQEAVRRREEQLPHMPSDLNERLMNSLTPNHSPRRGELKWLLLVAASLILVVGIGFKFLMPSKQTETKVVQTVEHEEQPAKQPVVEPIQPVVAKAEEPLQQKPSKRSKPIVRKEKKEEPLLAEAAEEPLSSSLEGQQEALPSERLPETRDPYLALEAQAQDIRSRGERFRREIAQLME